MKITTDIQKIKEIVDSRYIEAIFPSKEILEKILSSGKELKIYIGVDATGPQLHLGHSTNFLLLKKFQKLGHRVVFLIGDFTAQIGDPTGKSAARRALTKKDVLENCKGYKSQVKKILDFTGKNAVKLEFNGKWYEKFTLAEAIKLMAKATHGQMIKREMFQARLREGKEIYLHEFLYPLLQGYDSVVLNVDIEIGGNDQTFNMLVGRDLVKECQEREKLVIATKLLVNPKTQKKLMSKSEGDFIALNDSPNDMYGKVMSLPDETIVPCFELCTEISQEAIEIIKKRLQTKEVNPRDIKAKLAEEIVSMYYGKKGGETARKEFNKVFKEKQLPSEISEVSVSQESLDILDLLTKTGLCPSKSEAKRLVSQGGVKIDGQIKRDWKERIKVGKGMILRVGKRNFRKIV